MKRFICYLYEYQNGKPVRNVGFSKVEAEEETCAVSIHGKGWGADTPKELGLYLFYEEDGHCYGMYQGMLGNISPALNYRLIYRPEDTGGKERFQKVGGFILCHGRTPRYAAIWSDTPVDISRMEEPPRGEDEKQERNRDGLPQENVTLEKAEEETEEIEEKTGREAESIEDSAVEEMQSIENNEEEEEEPRGKEVELIELKGDQVEDAGREEDFIETGRFQCQKIKRQDISKLVRREWHLANNSFLLHGYYNYHHLAFIQEDVDLYLGVPGMYCEKERRAAQAFGFPRFVRYEDDMMTLSDAEKEECPDFGYWCRQVHQIRV